MGGPASLMDPILERRLLGQGWTSRILQRILHSLLTNAESVDEVARARKEYARRRRAAVRALSHEGVTVGGVDGIKLGAEGDIVTGLAQAIAPFQITILSPGNVHEQVDGSGRVGNENPEFGEAYIHVVAAIVVIMRAAQKPVALIVARGDQRVMAAR